MRYPDGTPFPAGLAERVCGGWRCSLDEQTFQTVLTWFCPFHEDDRTPLLTGIVKARQGTGPEHYVRCTNSEGLTPTISVHPVKVFPLGNPRPLWPKEIGGQWTLTRADGVREEGWVLSQASDADRAALQARGFFTTAPSSFDSLSSEAQLAATTTLERQGHPVPPSAKADIAALAERFTQAEAGMWAAARQMADDETLFGNPIGTEPESSHMNEITKNEFLAAVRGEVYDGTASEPVVKPKLKVHLPESEPTFNANLDIELRDDLLARMFANLAAHAMTLKDLSV